MFVHSVKMNKQFFKIFSPSGSHTILVFPYQTAWQYSDGNPPNGGVDCRWGRQKSQLWGNIWLYGLLLMLQQADVVNLVDHRHHLTSCDTSLVVSGGVDCGKRRWNVYDKKFQRYAKDNRTVHLTARSNKSVAYVTNNKRLYSTFCTIEANYWQTRSIARLLCDSRAACH